MLANALKLIAARVPHQTSANLPIDDAIFCKQFDTAKVETWCAIGKKIPGSVAAAAEPEKLVYDAAERAKEYSTMVIDIQPKPVSNTKNTKWIPAAFVISENRLEGNEFFHEVAINLLLSKYCADLPMFHQSQLVAATWHVADPNCVDCEKRTTMRHRNASPPRSESRDRDRDRKRKKRKTPESGAKEGNRIWFRAVSNPALSLEDAVRSIAPEQLVSVLFQTLLAIRLAQDRIKLKHHDMHLGNVMLAETDIETETYTTPEGAQTIKLRGLRVVLIDYGLSSAVDPETGRWVKRLDEALLMADDKSDTDAESTNSWGVWGEPLANDEGYDAAMLIESLTEALFEDRPLDIKKLDIISNLQRIVLTNFTDRGRPSEKTECDWGKIFTYLSSKQ